VTKYKQNLAKANAANRELNNNFNELVTVIHQTMAEFDAKSKDQKAVITEDKRKIADLETKVRELQSQTTTQQASSPVNVPGDYDIDDDSFEIS
jgi:phage shock protein A